MRRIRAIAIGLLAVYSTILICIELKTSQSFVRNFFTDIEGPVPFYGINTTLSVFFLWATALLFVVCLACTEGAANRSKLRWFYLSQVFVFAFLGFDDRFKFHELVGRHLGIADHWVLLFVATLEVAFLFVLGGVRLLKSRAGVNLGIASALFAMMIFIDGFVRHDLVLRLSLEDLAKTWAALFFFLFAWQLCVGHIERLKGGEAMTVEGPGTWAELRQS